MVTQKPAEEATPSSNVGLNTATSAQGSNKPNQTTSRRRVKRYDNIFQRTISCITWNFL